MQRRSLARIPHSVAPPNTENPELKVLVINACQSMAKEISLELARAFIGASITYAPTVKLAKFMLSRRHFDLVVASSRMPDGNVQALEQSLQSASKPTNLVIIGDANGAGTEMLGVRGYLFSALQKLPNIAGQESDAPKIEVAERIKSLGSDLRNDLNNPLQEIVAMAYVAQSQSAAEVTSQALEAITRAAGNLAHVVKNIEEKIRISVGC